MKLKFFGQYLFYRCEILRRPIVAFLLWCSTYIDEEYLLEKGLVLDHHKKWINLWPQGKNDRE